MRISPMLLGTAACLSLAQPAAGETLAEAVAQAYRTNPSLGAGRYSVRQADEGVVQAMSELRPSVSLQATASYDHSALGNASRSPFSPTISNRNGDNVQLSLSQPLYTGGKATADRRSAEASVGAAREALRGTEGDLLLAVVTAYLDVRRYRAALNVWQASVAELERLVKEIEARREAGELTLTDVAQARNQLEQEREQAVSSEQQLEAARADFADFVGHDAGELAAPPDLPGMPRSADAAFAAAAQRSPELARALFTERASRADIVSTRAAGLATLSLRAVGTLSGEVYPYSVRNQDRDVTGTFVLSVPLSAGGRIASQVRQAEDRNGQDRLQIEAARRDLVRDVMNAWNASATAQRAAVLISDRRTAATTQLEGMLAEYRVGLRSTFDVLFAQQSLRDAQIGLLGAERDRYVAGATLLRRIGGLEARDLVAGVPLYNPASHLSHVERINALPTDGVIAAVDRATRKPRLEAVELPAEAASPRTLPGAPAATDQPMARTAAQVPLLGTAGTSPW
jgi:outer membrane protein